MDNSNRSADNLRLPIGLNVPKEILEARIQSWNKLFEKYSMDPNDAVEVNLKTLLPVINVNDGNLCVQRLPMRNPISSVQYWVDTGKPPCLSIADVNYNSPEETSLSEGETSASLPAAISPFEHNSPHPPQPAIIPSEPTKPYSSIVSSGSVDTRDYILSSNLAKKNNIPLTIMENFKSTDIAESNNNTEEQDVYIDVCGMDEFPKIINHQKLECSYNSQQTTVENYFQNSAICSHESQATTIMRQDNIPKGSLKIEDVIPSLRGIRDSPEISVCEVSSEKSVTDTLEDLFDCKEKCIPPTIVFKLAPIEKEPHRRKLFTVPNSPVELSVHLSPKKLTRHSSVVSTDYILHPAFHVLDEKKPNQNWRKKSLYRRKLSNENERNKTVPLKKSLDSDKNEFDSKLKHCSVVINPIQLSNLRKRRNSQPNDSGIHEISNKPNVKKVRISLEKTPEMSNQNSESSTEKEDKKENNSTPMEENKVNSKLNLSKSPEIKNCSVILNPLHCFPVKENVNVMKIVSQSNENDVQLKKSRILNKTSINKQEKQTRNSTRISNQKSNDLSKDLRNSFKVPEKRNKTSRRQLLKEKVDQIEENCVPKISESESSIFQFRESFFKGSDSGKLKNGDKTKSEERKRFRSILELSSDEEFDMTYLFGSFRNEDLKLNKIDTEETVKTVERFNGFVSEEGKDEEQSILNTQTETSATRRRPKLVIVSSSEDEEIAKEKISKKEKIPRKMRKRKEKVKEAEHSKVEKGSSLNIRGGNKSDLNTQFEKTHNEEIVPIVENSVHSEESEDENIFDLCPKKNETKITDGENKLILLNKTKYSKQKLNGQNSKEMKKEENFNHSSKNESFFTQLKKYDKNSTNEELNNSCDFDSIEMKESGGNEDELINNSSTSKLSRKKVEYSKIEKNLSSKLRISPRNRRTISEKVKESEKVLISKGKFRKTKINEGNSLNDSSDSEEFVQNSRTKIVKEKKNEKKIFSDSKGEKSVRKIKENNSKLSLENEEVFHLIPKRNQTKTMEKKESEIKIALNSSGEKLRKMKIKENNLKVSSDEEDVFVSNSQRNETREKESEKKIGSNSSGEKLRKTKIKENNLKVSSDEDVFLLNSQRNETNEKESEKKTASNSRGEKLRKTKIKQNLDYSSNSSDSEDIFYSNSEKQNKLSQLISTSEDFVETKKENGKRITSNLKKETPKSIKRNENFKCLQFSSDSEDEDIFNIHPKRNSLKTNEENEKSKRISSNFESEKKIKIVENGNKQKIALNSEEKRKRKIENFSDSNNSSNSEKVYLQTKRNQMEIIEKNESEKIVSNSKEKNSKTKYEDRHLQCDSDNEEIMTEEENGKRIESISLRETSKKNENVTYLQFTSDSEDEDIFDLLPKGNSLKTVENEKSKRIPSNFKNKKKIIENGSEEKIALNSKGKNRKTKEIFNDSDSEEFILVNKSKENN